MSLGVLNNISAVYAEHNLNNSNTSLNTVLQQLSSGSKINSGADDAAGLSLVNGLEANQTALTQSQTNAQEGVGLLQVADGALSQVTNLLNRAVTLATEASTGTLTGSQYTAANQEYQSILSEVNNIGTTTTYNQQAVFNTNTNIYTGDSSNTGASIDNLNIRSLSSSNLGDTNGAMAYSSGASGSSVFIDLGAGAVIGDTLNAAGNGTTITVNTLSNSGAVVQNAINVGGTSGYANTAQGMINAINNSGLGLTASFTNAAVAGDAAAGAKTDTGIMITGSVGSGNQPTQASFAGSATAAGAADANVLTGSITFQVGNGAATTVTMAQVAAATNGATVGSVTLDDLVSYLNSNTALGVMATDGTQGGGTAGVLGLSSSDPSDPALKVTSNLTDTSLTTGPAQLAYTATAAYSDGITTGTFASTGITDSTTHQVAGTGGIADTIDEGTAGSAGGIATISYTDKSGQSLSATDLSNQADAETALTSLNAAIIDVAAQDGYIGAQINTLNAASQVLSTQSENITSAQNAVQATDYASATSNMSKYEILSQTGISALAQANSVQQEVTKLLQ
jgi:flagellin